MSPSTHRHRISLHACLALFDWFFLGQNLCKIISFVLIIYRKCLWCLGLAGTSFSFSSLVLPHFQFTLFKNTKIFLSEIFNFQPCVKRSYAILLLQLLGYVALISNEDSSTMEEIFLNPFITVFNSDDSELCLLGWFFTYSAASILMVKLC